MEPDFALWDRRRIKCDCPALDPFHRTFQSQFDAMENKDEIKFLKANIRSGLRPFQLSNRAEGKFGTTGVLQIHKLCSRGVPNSFTITS